MTVDTTYNPAASSNYVTQAANSAAEAVRTDPAFNAQDIYDTYYKSSAEAADAAAAASAASPTGTPPPDSTPIPKPTDKRPPGDNRSAQEIIASCPTLANLGNQKDIKTGKDGLTKSCGDWQHDPDAAYRAVQVVNYIKSCRGADGSDRGSVSTNGKMEGITKGDDARNGTEAGIFKNFGENGYSALPANHCLPPSSDTHVNANGTNQSNDQWNGNNFLHGGLLGVVTGGKWNPLKIFGL